VSPPQPQVSPIQPQDGAREPPKVNNTKPSSSSKPSEVGSATSSNNDKHPMFSSSRPPEQIASEKARPQDSSSETPLALKQRPRYSLLSQCKINKQKYNVMAVVSEVLESKRKRKSKVVSRVLITDESLDIVGDLRGVFKFDILADNEREMPELEPGTVIRVHHMVVEMFMGRPGEF